MSYISFSDDDLYRANTADLVSYLGGGRVKRVGSTYRYIYTDGSGTHDSVTIHGGKWYDHKNQRGGYAFKIRCLNCLQSIVLHKQQDLFRVSLPSLL